MGSLFGNPEENAKANISRKTPTSAVEPQVVIRQGTSFDKGVLRTEARKKYENVLR